MKNFIRSAFTLGLVVLSPAFARAQEGRALDRLPAETVGAVVFPETGKWSDTMAKTTRLGQLLNDTKRWTAVSDAMKEGVGKKQMETLQAKLAQLNLKPEDLRALMAHDCGIAVVLLKKSSGEPLPMILLWSGCGQPLAEKLKAAALDPKMLETKPGHAAKRTDITASLTRLRTGSIEAPKSADDEETPPAAPARKDQPAVGFIGAAGGYFVGAFAVPGAIRSEDEFAAVEALATPVVAAFVEAQKTAGAGVFSQRMLHSQAIRDTVNKSGEGTLAEILVDVPALVKIFQDSMVAKAPAKAAQTEKMIKALGLDGAGPLALVIGSSAQRLTSTLVWECPAPRRGLLRLLDQKATAPHVPDWVDDEVMQYARYNFDLAGAMDIVLASMKDAAPTEKDAAKVDQGVLQANQAIGSMAGGLTLRDMLAGFGPTLQLVTYLPPAETAAATARRNPSPFAQLENSNMAFVWQDANPEVWRKVMNAISRVMSGPNAPIQRAEEQGYLGWAIKPGVMGKAAGGLFLGKEALVLGFGRDINQKVITGLVTPGKHNHLLEDCLEVMPLRDAWVQTYGDMRPQMKGLRGKFVEGVEMGFSLEAENKLADSAQLKKARLVLDAIKQALPTDAEVDESFGMIASQGWTDDTGFHSQSALVLQPAK